MSAVVFDPNAVNRALREHIVARLGGDPNGVLDERQMFYLQLVAETGALAPGKHLVDLGPGLALFGPVARGMGLRVTLIDDFGGGGGVELGVDPQEIQMLEDFEKKIGCDVVHQNFLVKPLPLADSSVDVVTCFHSLEHWHHSPRRLFREIRRVLRPGGHLILATPNAVNVRKRFYLALGRDVGAPLREWYSDGDPEFRGHVREPTIADLHDLMRWNGFEVRATYGRNFIGRQSEALSFLPGPTVEWIAKQSDRLLRFFPTLCSDIHVTGRKQ